jgi:hypothetical protein
MKKILLLFTTVLVLIAFPKLNFGQAPTLGTTASFALFTAAGAFDNTGASVITGDVGSFNSSPTGFPVPGTVVGNIYNVGNPVLTSAFADVGTAFGNYGTGGSVLGTPLETVNTTGYIYAGTYHTVGAAVMNGNFTLDAQGDPNALFVININGALTVGAGFNVLLINSASLCNVYWQINGDFTLGAGSVFRGTIVSNGAITLLDASSLLGRGLTTAGAISLHNNVVTVNSIPAAAGTITGTASVCAGGTGIVYSVPAINNATSYTWALPAGATISAGNNTNSITVDFSAGSAGGNITVQGTNACANGTVSANFAVTVVPIPVVVAGVSGTICMNTDLQIGETAVMGNTYSWSSVPIGFTSTEAQPTVRPSVPTTYTVTKTVVGTGCSGSNSVVINLNPLPLAIAGVARVICQNSSTQIGTPAVAGNTYSWSSVPAGFTSSDANPTVTPIQSTIYTVTETVTSTTGCSNSNSVVVTVNPLPAAIAGADRALCIGSVTQIGAARVAGNTYSWSSVPAGFTSTEANPTVQPLVTTTYTVVETNTATSCTNSNSVAVTLNPLPVAFAGIDRTTCINADTQIGEVAAIGNTYSWNSVPAGFTSTEANPIVRPSVPSTYTVTKTVVGTGCSNSSSVVINLNPLPLAIAGISRVICQNSSTRIGAPAVVGNTYSWSSVPAGFTSSEANPTVTPSQSTTYTVTETITLTTGCTNSNSVVVTVNPLPAAIAGADRVLCINSSTQIGAAPVPGNTYSWSSVPAGFTSTEANPTVSPLVKTTYTVTETIAATGCTNSNSVVVSLNPIPEAIAGTNRSICLNASTQIGRTPVPGSTYSWSSVPAGFYSTEANPTVSPTVETTYTVTEIVAASGCTNSNSVVVSVNFLPVAVAGADRSICLNASTQIGGTSVSGSTYSWSSVPAGFTSTEANPTISPLVKTVYTVTETIAASGCTNSNSVVISLNPIPVAVAGADRSICLNSGTQIGGVAVSGSTYSWSSVPTGFTSIEANPLVNPLVKTTYTVTETTVANGCKNSSSVIISINSLPAAVAGADRFICLNTGTKIGASPVPGSIYNWSSVPAGFTSTEANPTISPLVETTYTVTETITASGCTNSNSVVISVNPIPVAVAGKDRTICPNSVTQLGATAVTGSTYNWSSVPTGFTSTDANPFVNPTVKTTYTVTETSTANSCTNSNSVTVNVNSLPAAVAGVDRSICQNTYSQIGATPVAGSTYSWNSVPGGYSSTIANPTINPLVTTRYIVTETNANTGCANSNSIVVTLNPIPVAFAGTDVAICLNEGTRIGAAPVPGSTYQWSSVPVGFDSNEANQTVNPQVKTTYTVTETIAATGCSNSNSIVVSINPIPEAVAGTDRSICLNTSTQIGAVAVTGNTYTWSSVPAGFTSNEANPTVHPLVTTTYMVTETTAASRCTNSNKVVVTVNSLPQAFAGANRALCINSSTTLGAAAKTGSTYSWSSTPAGFTSTIANPTVTPLETTTYTVVETIADGCENSNNVVITVNPKPAAVAGVDQSICLETETKIGTVGVSGNTYSWSSVPSGFTSTLANPTINPKVTTTYTLTETNVASGCQNTNAVTVVVNTAPNITSEPANQTACIGNPVSFSVTATGTGLTYQWRKGTLALTNGGNISGANSETLTINPVSSSDEASNYNVVTNGACSKFDTSKDVSLTVNAAPSLSTAVCSGSSVSFSASAIGTGLTYQWRKGDTYLTDGGNVSGANSATLTINPVTPDDASSNYNVVISGACSPNGTSLQVSLTVNPALKIITGPTDQTACEGSTASFSATAEGAGLTYQWRKGEVNLVNGSNISGATSATLKINSVTTSDVASNYNVVITGSCSPISVSNNASLSLCIPTSNTNLKAGDTTKAITIYPNPFNASLEIRINEASKINNYILKIYNILGEEVISARITKDITNLDTSKLPSGIYMYEMNSNNETIQSGKLISQQ